MGTTLIPVKFFDEEFAIVPHSATDADHLDRPVTVREFAAGDPVGLWKVEETGEYRCTKQCNDGPRKYTQLFIEGVSLL